MSQLILTPSLMACSMPDVPKPEPNEAETLQIVQDARLTLEARRKHLLNQLEAVETILTEMDRLVASMSAPRVRERKRAPGPTSVIKPAIIEILKAHPGEPLHADAILAAVRAKGISVSEKDPKATIVTALLRMARTRGEKESGVVKAGGNRFRWVEGENPSDPSTEPPPPSALFAPSLLALASQREHVRL